MAYDWYMTTKNEIRKSFSSGSNSGFPNITQRQHFFSIIIRDDISTKQASNRTMATTSGAQATTNADTATNLFHVGQLVNVEPRTWPGINQPGGIGRITGLARDRVSVRYVLDGRHEKEIDIKYVGIHQQGPIRRLRNRSMLLGRCNVCGSLRTDCGSCDLWIEEEQVRASRTLARATEDSLLLATHNEDDDDGNINDDKSSSSDNEEFEKIQKQNQRRYRKYLRMKARAQPYFDDSSSDGSSEKNVQQKSGHREREENASDDSSDSEDDLPLHQLALQASQMEPPVPSRRRLLASPLRNPSKKTRHHRRKVPRSKRMGKSILEQLSEPKESTPRSDSSPLARVSLVRSPGSEDMSDSTTSSRGEPPARAPAPAPEAYIEESTQEFENEDYSVLPGSTQDGFIQPEGNAEELPEDIRDRTQQLKYSELSPFFDRVAVQLENDWIPDFKLRLAILEAQCRKSLTSDVKEELFKESQEFHDEIIRDLIRRGLDQCQSVMRKLSSRRLYRQQKASLTEEERKQCRGSGKREAREFRLDTLNQTVEMIVSKTRKLADTMAEDDDRWDLVDEGSGSDGWMDPLEGNSEPQVLQESPLGVAGPRSDLSPFDPHKHANTRTVRRVRSAVTRHGTKQSKKRVREATTKSTRHRPSTRQRDPNSEATNRRRQRHKERMPEEKLEGKSENETDSRSNPDTDPSRDSDDATMFASNDDYTAVFPDDETPGNDGKDVRLKRRRAVPESAFFDAGAQVPGRSDTENGKDRIPIADRMQRFLDANEGGGLNFSPESIGNREKSQRRVRRNRPSARSRNVDSHGTGSDNISQRAVSVSPAEEEGVNPVELFSLLDDAQDRPVDQRQVRPPCEETMPDLCQFLIENFPDSTCANVLDAIVAKATTSISEGSENRTLVFTTLLQVLQCHGKATLQELVSAESASLDVHVSLLATSLRLLQLGANSNLTLADGVVFEIFSPGRCDRYIDFMVVQTVEAVFSLVHPSAWALKIKSPRKMLRALEPLRDALGEHVHVVERASRCLEQELEPQKWRCVRNGEHVFVSSLNPDLWLAFLDSGAPRPESGTLRSLGFQKELPRCEVNAIWSLLAYLSCSTKPILDEKGVHRWQLISKLFTRSVLAGSPTEPLPPCESQLDICAGELKHLTSLLLSGALDCLPGRDSILVNLVRRSLLLQGDAFLYDEDSRMASYPSIKDEKAEKRFMVKLWEKIGDETITVGVAQGRSAEFGRALSSQKVAYSFMGQPLLLPSSWITRCCLALLSAWTQRVPVKKARLSRLANAVNSLTKSLIAECAQLDSEPVSTAGSHVAPDSFQAAFSSSPYSSSTPVRSGLGSRRKALFLREAAAYLTIMSTSTALTQNGDRMPYTSVMCERVWNILADNDMKSRREKILSNPDARHAVYSGDDSFRLYLAAKVVTFLALMFLGITPWNETLTERTLQVSDSVSNVQGEESGLEFLVSCLVTCLNCASDSRHCVEITASISSCIGIVLMNARRLNLVNPSRFLQRAICRLATLPNMIGHTLEKSFQLLVTASFCGPEEDICLMSLLSVLRGSLSWTTCRDLENDRDVDEEAGVLNPRVENGIVDEPQDDEFWGGLDDDLLASIDLATSDAGGGHHSSDTGSLTGFCRLLSVSLEQAKPSKRFEIVQSMVNASSPDVAVLTSSGRKLIANRSGPLCRCLAAILASEKNESSSTASIVSQIWTAPVRFPVVKDHRDSDFQSSMARIISSELCNLALSSARCRKLVLGKQNEVLGDLLETLLDPKVFKKYPSCNLPRIKQNGGSSSEQKELSRLMKISDNIRTTDEFWNFCSDFGLALQGQENETLNSRSFETSALLLNPDSDLSLLHDRRQIKMVPSLEKEYLDRFRIFRGIAINTRSTSASEMMASVVLHSSSGHMVALVKRFRIQERCREEMDSAENYGRAKIFEEISSYIEFHVSIISWVFHERRHAVSGGPLRAWCRVCDDYFSPLLQGKHIDVVRALTQIISSAGSAHEDRGSSVAAMDIAPAEPAAYHDMIKEAILRRSREFMIEIAHEFSAGNTWRSSNFFRAMISAGTSNDDRAAWMISRSFCSKAYSLPPTEGAIKRSPLQSAIDDYLGRVEKCHPLADEDTRSLLLLKRHALKEVLIPRLGHERSLVHTKCGILRLLRLMLDTEHDEGKSADTDTRLNTYTLCYLAKGVCLSLRTALSANCVDDELVSSSFLCARSLINLPATCVDHDAVGWLIHWCSSCATDCAASDSTVKQSKAGYLWSFSRWLNDLGLFICDASGEASESMQTYRNTLRKPQDPGDKTSWPPIKKEGTDSASRMREYEKVLFPDRENDQNITNVYASRRESSNVNEPMEVWIPNTNVQRSVKSFVAEVKPILKS